MFFRPQAFTSRALAQSFWEPHAIPPDAHPLPLWPLGSQILPSQPRVATLSLP